MYFIQYNFQTQKTVKVMKRSPPRTTLPPPPAHCYRDAVGGPSTARQSVWGAASPPTTTPSPSVGGPSTARQSVWGAASDD